MHGRLSSSTSSELRAALPPPALASSGPAQPNAAHPPPRVPSSPAAGPAVPRRPSPPLPAPRSLREVPAGQLGPPAPAEGGEREEARGREPLTGSGRRAERPPVPAAGQAVPRAPRLPLAASFRSGIGGKNSNRRRGRRATGARPGPRRDRRAPAAPQRAAPREHCFCGASPPACHSAENANPFRRRDKRGWVRSSQKLTPELFLKDISSASPARPRARSSAGLGSLRRLTSSVPAVPRREAGPSHLWGGRHRPLPLLPPAAAQQRVEPET